MLAHRRHELRRAHPGAEIDDLEAGALEHHRHEVLADVVEVALDRAEHHCAGAGGLAFGKMRLERVQGSLHHAGAQQHLGDEALAALHARPDDLHAGQQGAVEDLAGAATLGEQHRHEGGHEVAVAGDDGLFDLVVQRV